MARSVKEGSLEEEERARQKLVFAFSSHRPHLPLLPPHAAQVPPVPFCFQVTWRSPGPGCAPGAAFRLAGRGADPKERPTVNTEGGLRAWDVPPGGWGALTASEATEVPAAGRKQAWASRKEGVS